MTQTMIGFDYEGVPCLKITKGDIDAGEEPDENVGSFLYNSKWAKDYKLAGIELMSEVGSNTFWPAGSGLSNYQMYQELTYPAGQAAYIRAARYPRLDYTFPLCEVKSKRTSNGRFVGSIIHERMTNYLDGFYRSADWTTGGERWFGWGSGMTVFYNASSGSLGTGTHVMNYFSQPSGLTYEAFYNNLVVWNLPGDEAAILDADPPPPVQGQHVIEIDSAGVRVAKPGFDLNNITRPSQLAFDSANSPTKIIGAADVACPAGASSYDIGVTIPENAVADVFFYQGSTAFYPGYPVDLATQLGAEYWFDGSLIRFNNTFAACRARFIIYSNSTEAPTSGDNDVFRQIEVDGQNVVQILRPGAADPPNFSDIVIDSRWPCIQVLAEGYIPVGTGELTHTVNFDGTGCFPVVKYMTIHGAGTRNDTSLVDSWSKRVRQPFIHLCASRKGGWSGGHAGDSTYCSFTNSQAVFRTFKGNPVRRYYLNLQNLDNNIVSYEYDRSPITGLRYYILGIPA